MTFSTTPIFVRALANALTSLQLRDRVLPLVPPSTRASLTDPGLVRVHDGAVALHVCTALADEGLSEKLFEEQLRRTLGSVLGPLLKVMMALAGNSPAAAFSRLDDMFKVLMSGVTPSWAPSSASSGVVTIAYPADVTVDRFAAHGWAGALRYAYEIAGVKGTAVPQQWEGSRVTVAVSWTPR